MATYDLEDAIIIETIEETGDGKLQGERLIERTRGCRTTTVTVTME